MNERKPIGLTVPHRKSEQADAIGYLYRDQWGAMKLAQTMPPPTGSFPVYTSGQLNDKLEAMAIECERMPFGDTSASFAAWIRGHKV